MWGDQIEIWMKRVHSRDGSTEIAVPEPVVLRVKTREELAASEGLIAPPFLSLAPEDAQSLMDELWSAGLRPSEGSGSAGSLAATERHLEDMRALVFRKNVKVTVA